MVLHQFVQHPPVTMLVVTAAVLALVEWGIVACGRKFAIGPAVVDGRSSHSKFTPTCGGLVWALAAIAAAAMFGNLQQSSTWIFMGGIAVLGIVSVIDDIHPLRPLPRLLLQIAVMALTFKALLPHTTGTYLLVLFGSVGIINALNFLDGICGMLALYGIVVTASLLYYCYHIASPALEPITAVLIIVLVAQIVFAAFNLGDIIFAGDAGSITLGYIQVVAAMSIAIATGDPTVLIFFSVCLFDTGLTTIHRLFNGERIMQPHRSNIYQQLTSGRQLPQRGVSFAYATLQLGINTVYFLLPADFHLTYLLVVCSLLTLAYLSIRSTRTTA